DVVLDIRGLDILLAEVAGVDHFHEIFEDLDNGVFVRKRRRRKMLEFRIQLSECFEDLAGNFANLVAFLHSNKPEARNRKPGARSQKPEWRRFHSGFWLLAPGLLLPISNIPGFELLLHIGHELIGYGAIDHAMIE